jgi:tetratricopeptide (TPR) repeat protein
MNRRAATYCAVALLVTTAIYFPVARFQFVNWDDRDLLLQNPSLNPPTYAHFLQIWSAPRLGLYAPLSYSVWWAIAGFVSNISADPGLFHLLNLALHLICVALVFAILRKFIPSLPAVLAGTLVFALHPMQVETVAWVSEFNNLLAAAFSLAGVLPFVHYASRPQSAQDAPQRRNFQIPLFYSASTVLFTLALLSKPTAVVVPLIACVLIFQMARQRRLKTVAALLPWFLLAAVFSFIAHGVQKAPAPPILHRPVIALDAIGFYAVKFVAPFRLTVDYARTPARVMSGGNWLPTSATALAALALLFIFRRQRLVVAGLLIALLALLPLLGFVPFAFQRYSTVADHFLYLPMLGGALAVGSIVALLDRRRQIGAVLLFVIALGALASWQLETWRDTRALAGHILALDPLSTVGNKIVAAEFSRLGEPGRAVPYYVAALVRNPNDADLHFNLGNALLHLRRFDEAILEYQRTLNLPSDNLKLDAMNNLGSAYAGAGRPDLAADEFNQVLRIQHDNPGALYNLHTLSQRNHN